MVFRNLVAFAALSVTLLLDQATNVEASCMFPVQDVCELSSAAIIARVHVETVTLLASSTADTAQDFEARTVVVTVQEVYKGMVTAPSEVTFTTDAIDGPDLLIEKSYVISLFRDEDGDLYASPCGLVELLPSSDDDSGALEALEADLEACNFDLGAEYMGCFLDKADERVLDHEFDSDEMTNELCIDRCLSNGFAAAATQFSEQCWCHPTGSTSFSKHGDTGTGANCFMDCAGDDSEKCGGRLSFSLWMLPSAEDDDATDLPSAEDDDLTDGEE